MYLDGKPEKMLLHGGIIAVTRWRDLALAVTTGSHRDTAELVEILDAPPRVGRRTSIRSTPDAVLTTKGGDLLVATSTGLMRLTEGLSFALVHTSDWSERGPHTMVEGPDGSLYLGAWGVVIRLRPADEGYVEDWLVPQLGSE